MGQCFFQGISRNCILTGIAYFSTENCDTHSKRGEKVPDAMSCDQTIFPTAIWFCLCRDTGGPVKTGKHTLRIHLVQERCIQLCFLLPQRIADPHIT